MDEAPGMAHRTDHATGQLRFDHQLGIARNGSQLRPDSSFGALQSAAKARSHPIAGAIYERIGCARPQASEAVRAPRPVHCKRPVLKLVLSRGFAPRTSAFAERRA